MNKKTFLRSSLVFVLLFCLFFGLLFQFTSAPFYDSDEGDIYSNGAAIASGLDLYSEATSQHMPFTYYLSALFWHMGAHSITAQRLAFYAFFALMWSILYLRYQSDVGKTALIAYPVLFIFSLCLYEYGTVILSEHLAAIGFVMLVLEFLRFCKTRQVPVDSCIAISFGIVLTFGTIFIAAYGVAAVALFVLIKEIQWLIQDRQSFKQWLLNGLKLLLKLAFWCLLPWVVLVVIYAINGNLEDAIYYAYTFNRSVYAEYVGGYGSDALAGAVSGLWNLRDTIRGLLAGGLELSGLAQAVVVGLAALGIICQLLKRRFVEALFFAVLLVELATRGVWNYHGTQCVAILCLLGALALGDCTRKARQNKLYILGSAVLAACMAFTALPYAQGFSTESDTTGNKTKSQRILDAITEDGEPVFVLAIAQNELLIQGNVVPYKAMGVPWFTDVGADQIIRDYPDGITRVVIYDEENSVWNATIQDYAPEMCQYIQDNYTHVHSNIYVRNDIYDEVAQLLNDKALLISGFSIVPQADGTLTIAMSKPETTYDSIQFAIWSSDGGQDDMTWYLAEENEDELMTVQIDLKNHLLNKQEDSLSIYAYGFTGKEKSFIAQGSYKTESH